MPLYIYRTAVTCEYPFCQRESWIAFPVPLSGVTSTNLNKSVHLTTTKQDDLEMLHTVRLRHYNIWCFLPLVSNCSYDAQCKGSQERQQPPATRYTAKDHAKARKLTSKKNVSILCSHTHLPHIHTCFQVHPQSRFLGSGVHNLPLLRCAADACVHAGHEQAPGLWAASSGPRAPTQSWTRGNTASHFPATAASSAPERYLLPYPTSLQSTKTGKKRETVCEING